MLKLTLGLSLVFVWSGSALAQQGMERTQQSAIGYPTVADALADLSRRSDIQKSVQGNWRIFEDRATKTLWSITQGKHSAHPTAVRRRIVTENGKVLVRTKILCQAEKEPCDQVERDFRKLNQQIQAHLQRQARGRASLWKPDKALAAQATELVQRFLAAIDNEQWEAAHDFLGQSLKNVLSVEKLAKLQQKFVEIGGGKPVRTKSRHTWYKDPPRAPSPGIYAAFNHACSLPKQNYCDDIVILHQSPGGDLKVIRYERKFVNPALERRLRRQ
jgi:hypothetical protein